MTVKTRLERLENLTRKAGPLVAICTYPLQGEGHGLYTARYEGTEHAFTTEAAMFAHLEAHGVSIGLYVPGACTEEEWEDAAAA